MSGEIAPSTAAAADHGHTDVAYLTDQFMIHRTDKLVKLELHNEYLKLYNVEKSGDVNTVADLILNLKDVAGSSVGKGKEDTDVKSYFTIYAYIKPSSNKISKRKRKTFEFAYSKFATYDENFSHVNKWHLKLYNLLRLKTFIHQQRMINESHENGHSQQPGHREVLLAKPFLVLVNPKSGSGKGKNIYFERALPVWAEANIPDTTVFTRNF